jgi:hypothetical protein
MDIWVVSLWGIFLVMLMFNVYKDVFEFLLSISMGIYPEVELMDDMIFYV